MIFPSSREQRAEGIGYGILKKNKKEQKKELYALSPMRFAEYLERT
jgi:hypothetical protein